MNTDEFRLVHLVQFLCLIGSGTQSAYVWLKLLRLVRLKCALNCGNYAHIEQALFAICLRILVCEDAV